MTSLPCDWIKPDEFHFVNGEVCRLGPYRPSPATEVERTVFGPINERFRDNIARIRRDAGLPPIFWMKS